MAWFANSLQKPSPFGREPVRECEMSSLVSDDCRLEPVGDLDAGDALVTAGYDRIVSLLRVSLTERELNLFAEPVVDDAGALVSWRARSGRSLTPVSVLPAGQRALMTEERDRILGKVKSLADGFAARGDAQRADVEALTALSVPPESDDGFFSDGFGPVLVNWSCEINFFAAPREAAISEIQPPGDANDPVVRETAQDAEPELEADAIAVPEAVIGSENVIAWSGTNDDAGGARFGILKPRPKALAVASMAGAAALAVFVAWPETSTSPPANVGPNIGGDATDAALDRSVAPLTVPQLAAAPVPLDDLALPAVALAEDPVVRASGTTLHLETLAPDRPEAAIAKMLPVPNPLRPIAPVGIENHALTDQELGAVALAAVDVFHRPETAIAQLRSEPAQPLQAFAVDGIRAPLVDAGPMSTVESRIALDANGADVPSHAPLAAPVVTGEVSELTGLSVPADRPAGPSEGLTVMGGDPAGIDSDRLAAIEDALGLSRHSRADIQLRLKLLGFDPQGIDGIFGPRTRAAISGWQRAQGHVPTGYLDAAQRAQIDDTSEGLFLAWQREESALARARAAKVAAVADRERRIAAASRRFGGSRTSPELRGIGPSRPGSGRAGSPREAIGEFVRLFPAILDRIACERGRGRCRRH